MYSDVDASAILPETETKVLKDSRRSLVCLYSFVSTVQVSLFQYLTQDIRLCTVPFLPYPVERAVRSYIPFTFRAISLQAAFCVFCTHVPVPPFRVVLKTPIDSVLRPLYCSHSGLL